MSYTSEVIMNRDKKHFNKFVTFLQESNVATVIYGVDMRFAEQLQNGSILILDEAEEQIIGRLGQTFFDRDFRLAKHQVFN